jgi:hypothetical protein
LTTRVVLAIGTLAILVGCGGGGGSAGVKSTTYGINTAFSGAQTAGTSLSQYQNYTFVASAVDLNMGATITQFHWDFGDGTTLVDPSPVAGVSTETHDYQTSGTFTVSVYATDNGNAQGAAQSVKVTVAAAASPVTAKPIQPTGALLLQPLLGSSQSFNFQIAASTTSGGTFTAAGMNFNPNDSNATVGSITVDSKGNYTIPVTYLAGASIGSTRTNAPTATVTDSNGNASAQLTLPKITVTTTGVNHPATVAITAPASSPTTAFTSKPVNLVFTVSDLDNDPVTYTVDWGDGNTASSTVTNTSAGAQVNLSHPYPDSYTSGTKSTTVTVTVDDHRTTGTLNSQSCVLNVNYNAYPIATITSPQASGTLPSSTDLPSMPGIGLANPPGPSDPSLVVIPVGGKLTFNGNGSAPGSGDPNLVYHWTFQNGVVVSSGLSTASTPDPGDVVFSPSATGVITPCLVTLTVTDAFGRVSSNGPAAVANTYKKWVIVDGTNTQNFNLTFLYRQKSDGNGVATISPATTSANGYGALVSIYQDGITSTWKIASGLQATGSIPVRSNLPFYAGIPTFGADAMSYMVRIPNAPTGSYEDDTLGGASNAIPMPADTEGFGFQSSSAPWDPTLQVVTGQGFAAESSAASMKFIEGALDPTTANPNAHMTLGYSPVNNRWLNRLSVPANDSTGAIQWPTSDSTLGALPEIKVYQTFAEWTMMGLSLVHAPSTGPATAQTAAFVVNYSKYTASGATSDTFAIDQMQMFRVPGGSTDPYFLDDSSTSANWNNASCYASLNPTAMAVGGPATTFAAAIYDDPGGTALSGGIQNFGVPYVTGDPDRTPMTPVARPFNIALATTFNYAEYLWSSVWARPLVLNTANLNATASAASGLGSFVGFRYSNPTAWPKYLDNAVGIAPDQSTFDITPTGGAAFLAGSPVGLHGAQASAANGGVGRFYWTAFTPIYNGLTGAAISRTWLADESTGMPPLSGSFTGQSSGDATSMLGFIPPQDAQVDKRSRDPLTGAVTGATGGYRVAWYNPTKDADGNPVPPDFWVVVLGTTHFVLPANYPSGTQAVTDPILTDARQFLPLGGTTLQQGDSVAPGYCWFDVPVELRPATGSSISLQVFAVKSILANHPPAAARVLNRLDWIDAVKTATADISFTPANVIVGGSIDLSFAHKLPFAYPWDIVVANGAITTVAP